MIYFLVYLFIEVVVSVSVFSQIGGINSFFEILGSAVLGIFCLSLLRYIAQESIMATFENRALLYSSGQSSIFILVGSVMMIFPGVVSDVVGAFLVVGALVMFATKRSVGFKNQRKDNRDEDVIDVEIIEHNETIKREV